MSHSGTESSAVSAVVAGAIPRPAYSRSGSTATRRTLSSMSTTTPISLSHGLTSIDMNKPAVVIEIGEKLTKCGFAGEFSPRAIIRTEHIDELLVTRRDFFNGADETKKESLRPLFRFLKHIYYIHLLSMPRERRVIVVESLLCPTRTRRALCTCLLEMLDAPSVLFAPSHLLATFPFNTPTALVIDIGYKEVVAMPVAEGITMLSLWEAVPKGIRAVEERVRKLLEEHARIVDFEGASRQIQRGDWHAIEQNDLIEDIVVRTLFVSPLSRADALHRGEQPSPATPDVEFPLGAESLVVPGIVRETACEVLFEGETDDEPSLPELIHAIIARCPLDLRRKLFSRLLIVGGGALLPGLLPRLKAELVRLAEVRGLKTADEVKFYRFDKTHFELFTSWLGGSMFATLQETLAARSVSREKWLEDRHLPDTIDFVDPFDRHESSRHTRS